jgi:hypothetical protein
VRGTESRSRTLQVIRATYGTNITAHRIGHAGDPDDAPEELANPASPIVLAFRQTAAAVVETVAARPAVGEGGVPIDFAVWTDRLNRVIEASNTYLNTIGPAHTAQSADPRAMILASCLGAKKRAFDGRNQGQYPAETVVWAGVGNEREACRQDLHTEWQARAQQEQQQHQAFLNTENYALRRFEHQACPTGKIMKEFHSRDDSTFGFKTWRYFMNFQEVQDQQRMVITRHSGAVEWGHWYNVGPPRKGPLIGNIYKETEDNCTIS